MKGLRAALFGAVLVAESLAPLAAPPTACAAESAHAALVIDTGGAVQDFCVALPDDSVSGLELIELAGQQFGLDYKLGYGGGAVCMLAGVGSTSSDCFGEYPDFWGYWHGGSGGSWSWAGSGAGSSSVTSGDVEGWSWGSGDDGLSHPPPPATAFDSVCTTPLDSAGADKSDDENEPSPGGGNGAASDPSSTTSSSVPDDDTEAGDPSRRGKRPGSQAKGRGRAPATPAPTVSPIPARSPTLAASNVDESQRPAGPPMVGLAGLGAAVLLGAAGTVLARRRRTVSSAGPRSSGGVGSAGPQKPNGTGRT